MSNHFYKVPIKNVGSYQLEKRPKAIAALAEYEITETEYETELAAIKQRVEDLRAYTEQVKSGEITLEDVPEDCRDDVQRNVDAEAIVRYADQVKSGDVDLDAVPDQYRETVENALDNDPELQAINSILQEVSEIDY